jgi:peptide/nickel transport system substrate-binding protein
VTAVGIRMNDLVIQNAVVVPVLWRSGVSAVSAKLRNADSSPWDSDLWRLASWYREA